MNKEQYNKIQQRGKSPLTISVDDFTNKKDRTLIWGYTPERDSFHVYLKDKKIHLYVYTYVEKNILKFNSGRELEVDILIPRGRVYPEASDYEFCKKLLDMGINIPFTIFDGYREEKQFHGAIKSRQEN